MPRRLRIACLGTRYAPAGNAMATAVRKAALARSARPVSHHPLEAWLDTLLQAVREHPGLPADGAAVGGCAWPRRPAPGDPARLASSGPAGPA